jgi:cell division control protein 45
VFLMPVYSFKRLYLSDNIYMSAYFLTAFQRILLLVNYDVDAICTCKILQCLFRYDSIIYTLVPVQGITDLQKAYEENCEEVINYLLS